MDNKKVYIITRTHEREHEFNNCYKSLLKQTIEPQWVIISDSSNLYLNKKFEIPHQIVEVIPKSKKWWIRHHNFTNGYFNEVLPHIPDGNFVYFLDDDDFLISSKWIEEIIATNADILIGKFQLGSNHNNKLIGQNIKRGEIGGACYAIKTQLAKKFTWPCRGGGDFMYLRKLLKHYNPIFTDTIIASVQDNLGRSWKKRKKSE